jgi:hypothetical protein
MANQETEELGTRTAGGRPLVGKVEVALYQRQKTGRELLTLPQPTGPNRRSPCVLLSAPVNILRTSYATKQFHLVSVSDTESNVENLTQSQEKI